MADRSSASTPEVEARDRAIVERVAAGLSLRAVGAEFSLKPFVGPEDNRPRGRPSFPPPRTAPLPRAPPRRTPAVAQRGPVHGEIAHRLSVSKTTVHKLIKRHGMPMLVPPKRRKNSRESEHEVRNRAIAVRVAAGASHSKAATEFGISPQRVSQIMLALRAPDRIGDR